jgi:hypothetical protein
VGALGFSAAILFACLCGVAEARTLYTIAGGGHLPPPALGDPPRPATAIALVDYPRLARLPNGDFLISSPDRTLLLDAHGMVRAVPAPPPGPTVFGVDRLGTEYALDEGGVRLLLRRPGGSYQVLADLAQIVRFFPTDMLVHPDGGVLLASTSGVVRVLDDGSTVRVAGAGRRGSSRDGVPAREARLRYPTSLAWAADGALLIADRDDNRVRRVDPVSGRITTVAGTGRRGFGGDGGPAKAATLDWPTEIVVGPHGGFAIAESRGRSRIRRVSRSGIIRTVAGGASSRSSFGRGTSMLNGDGEDARLGSLSEPDRPQITPRDEYVFTDVDLIRFATSPGTTRLALALRTAVPARRRVSYTLSMPARLQLEVLGQGRRLVRRLRARPGYGHFRLPARLPPGGYHLTLTATNSTGISVRETGLVTTPRLSVRLAAAAIQAAETERRLITPEGLYTAVRGGRIDRPTRCRRFGTRRVDCVLAYSFSTDRECDGIHSAQLDRRGQIRVGEYGCTGFRRQPAWLYTSGPTPMLLLGPGAFDDW